MHQEFSNALFNIFSLPSSGLHPYLEIKVRREHLLEDAISQLELQNPSDHKKKLRVTFANEDAIDAGGVTKEFFFTPRP